MSSEVEQANLARKLLIEQTRKEMADQLRQYQVGFALDGQIIASKNSEVEQWTGVLLLIPHEIYRNLFEGIK